VQFSLIRNIDWQNHVSFPPQLEAAKIPHLCSALGNHRLHGLTNEFRGHQRIPEIVQKL
jgi:hypothetical protein